jgi:hypothetical protein
MTKKRKAQGRGTQKIAAAAAAADRRAAANARLVAAADSRAARSRRDSDGSDDEMQDARSEAELSDSDERMEDVPPEIAPAAAAGGAPTRQSARLAARAPRSFAEPPRGRAAAAPRQPRAGPADADAGGGADDAAEPGAEAIGASPSFAEAGGFSEATLVAAGAVAARFAAACQLLITGMVACGWCGRVALGGRHSRMHSHFRPLAAATVPPAVLANPLLVHLAPVKETGGDGSEDSSGDDSEQDGGGDGDGPSTSAGGELYWACGACRASAKRRAEQAAWWQAPVFSVPADDAVEGAAAAMEEQLVAWRLLLGAVMRLPPGGIMLMGVLQCGVRYAQRICGYVHAALASPAEVLSGPLICWDPDAATPDAFDAAAGDLALLSEHLTKTHPLAQRNLLMLERLPGMQEAAAAAGVDAADVAAAVPVLPGSVLGAGLEEQRARDPRETAGAGGGGGVGMSVALDAGADEHPTPAKRGLLFRLGTVVSRASGAGGAAATILGDMHGVSQGPGLSVDNALFPLLHPEGRGALRPGDSSSNTLAQRVDQLFSLFTLVPEYLLVMFQARPSPRRPAAPGAPPARARASLPAATCSCPLCLPRDRPAPPPFAPRTAAPAGRPDGQAHQRRLRAGAVHLPRARAQEGAREVAGRAAARRGPPRRARLRRRLARLPPRRATRPAGRRQPLRPAVAVPHAHRRRGVRHAVARGRQL